MFLAYISNFILDRFELRHFSCLLGKTSDNQSDFFQLQINHEVHDWWYLHWEKKFVEPTKCSDQNKI